MRFIPLDHVILRKSSRLIVFLLLLCLLSESEIHAQVETHPGIGTTVTNDVRLFFSPDRFFRMGIVFGGGALMANTSIDEDLQNRYQDNFRDSGTDDFAAIVKTFGEGEILIPLSVGVAAAGYLLPSRGTISHLGRWGQLTARAYLVGSPALFLMQRLTGASRPGETENGSRWHPFEDDNGVSGHAFVGAVPFLTMAHMSRERASLKYLFYTLSTLSAWSRINDNKHYPSQAILGWYMAWEATDAVLDYDRTETTIAVSPWIIPDVEGIHVRIRWR